MRLLLIAHSLAALAYCQVNNGFLAADLPNVVLQGQPRVVARRILHGQLGEVQPAVIETEPNHFVRVNVVENGATQSEGEGYKEGAPVNGIPVVVYRRILRPAKLHFDGKTVITDQWQGTDDERERQEFLQLDRSRFNPLFEAQRHIPTKIF